MCATSSPRPILRLCQPLPCINSRPNVWARLPRTEPPTLEQTLCGADREREGPAGPTSHLPRRPGSAAPRRGDGRRAGGRGTYGARSDVRRARRPRHGNSLAWQMASTLRTVRSEDAATEHEAARQLEAVEVEATRLAAQVRQMAAANRALRTANRTLIDANTELRRNTARASRYGRRPSRHGWMPKRRPPRRKPIRSMRRPTRIEADDRAALRPIRSMPNGTWPKPIPPKPKRTRWMPKPIPPKRKPIPPAAQADTAEAQADTANVLSRNEALHATVEEVQRANAALRPYRAELQELAAVLEAKRAQLAVVLAGIEDAVLVVDQAPDAPCAPTPPTSGCLATPSQPSRPTMRMVGRCPRPDAAGAGRAQGETFSMTFSLPTGPPSLAGEDTRRWFEANGRPFPESGATHALLVIRDTTLSDQHRRLQDEFLVLAGHELRTPLTVLQGYVDLLQPLLADARRCAGAPLRDARAARDPAARGVGARPHRWGAVADRQAGARPGAGRSCRPGRRGRGRDAARPCPAPRSA